MRSYLRSFKHTARLFREEGRDPSAAQTLAAFRQGSRYAGAWRETKPMEHGGAPVGHPGNPLWHYFSQHKRGPGVWKWTHYFDIYHRHFQGFIGAPVNVLEIGIYSGGSLPMWAAYFGDRCHVYGVDVEDACRAYESDRVSVFIGDQEDRSFWRRFKREVPGVDILIDDGGHTPEQQRVTLEEMLPHLQPGGVYLCEDVHGIDNRFAAYAAGLTNQLNGQVTIPGNMLRSEVTPFQQSIYSIHFYAYVVVIEKHIESPSEFTAPRHGTEWQPFL